MIGKVEFRGYVGGCGTDRLMVNGGGGGTTVRLARPVPISPAFWADASTEYVAGAVPAGTDLVMATEADDAGEIVRTFGARAVGHEPGNDDVIPKGRAEHPALSLLVTDTV